MPSASNPKPLLIHHIQSLAGIIEQVDVQKKMGNEMSQFDSIEHAWLLLSEGLIQDYGIMNDISLDDYSHCELLDASGRIVLPCFVD